MKFERIKNSQNSALCLSVRWQLLGVRVSALLFLIFSVTAPPALASELAYAQSPHSSPQTSHSVFNLFDGDESTAWCSTPAHGTNTHHVQVAFKKAVNLEHVSLVLLESPVEKLAIEISNGRNTVQLNLMSSNLHIAFETPFRGQVYDFYFATSHSNRQLCIAELNLLDAGIRLAQATPRHQKSRAPLAGEWFAGPPGSTEKKISFAIDGNWQWVHQPIFATQEKKMQGTYEIRGGKLLLRVLGTRKVLVLPWTKERVRIDPNDFDAPDFDYDRILLTGSEPHILAGSYTNARFDSLN